MAVEFVAISSLSVMSQYQMRVGLSDDVIDEYVGLIEGTERQWVFADPCRVIRVGSTLILVDGFHRVAAMEKAGKPAVLCDVTSGTAGDALRAALSSNSHNGARLTNADKRKKVLPALLDESLSKLSARQIGDLCGVSGTYVNTFAAENRSVECHSGRIRNTIGVDGKNHPASADDVARQRLQIVDALKSNAAQSDRAIARTIGCSPNTVGKFRKQLSVASKPQLAVRESNVETAVVPAEDATDTVSVDGGIKSHVVRFVKKLVCRIVGHSYCVTWIDPVGAVHGVGCCQRCGRENA